MITGVGVVSSIGLGREAFYAALAEGKSGITPVEGFDAAALGREYAGQVKAFNPKDHLTAAENRRMGRCSQMALAAARMAIEDAGATPETLRGPRTAVVIGTTMGEADVLEDLDHAWIARGPSGVKRAMIPKYGSTLLPIHIARACGAEGLVLTLPAACAAGNYAIGFAADLIRAGRADVVVTGAEGARQRGAAIGATKPLQVYVDEQRWPALEREHRIGDAGEDVNLIVRVVPSDAWSQASAERPAPLIVCAVDAYSCADLRSAHEALEAMRVRP